MDLIKTFVQVVKQSSFARAARLLGVAPSVVSKRITELERDLGVQLLLRTTRKVQLSDYGARYFSKAADLVQRFDELNKDAARHGGETWGSIRIASPTSIGIRYIGQILESFRIAQPGVRFELVLIDSSINPIEDGFDLVISEQPYVLQSTDLTEEPLCPIPQVVCATPAYLARRGTPASPRELVHHDCLHYSFLFSGDNWIFEGGTGSEFAVPVRPTFSTSNGLIMRSIALRDGGIMLLPTHIVQDELAAGTLVELFGEYRMPQHWLVAIMPPLSRVSRRVQSVVEHLKKSFSPPPWEATRKYTQRSRQTQT